ncbi:MAG TPA: sugar phosphate isomerase/epimerase family protein, partial [Candidatus Hydrogenedentes bacterium]|nr:sugar phosphate isomerase/epimerase family protein [Candidatus Hydrogenedentota bacterium]
RVRYGEAWERSQENIRELLPVAEELGVVIAVENVWNKFLLSPLEFARYVDEFESPWLQAYFDVGNVVIFGYPQDWIRTLGPRIRRLHIKDFKRDGYQWSKLPYEGDVDWPEVRKAIDEIGYDGWGTEEFPGGDEAHLRELSRRMTLLGEGARKA